MWQHVKLSEPIRPRDPLACRWDVKQPTDKQYPPHIHCHAYAPTSVSCVTMFAAGVSWLLALNAERVCLPWSDSSHTSAGVPGHFCEHVETIAQVSKPLSTEATFEASVSVGG